VKAGHGALGYRRGPGYTISQSGPRRPLWVYSVEKLWRVSGEHEISSVLTKFRASASQKRVLVEDFRDAEPAQGVFQQNRSEAVIPSAPLPVAANSVGGVHRCCTASGEEASPEHQGD